MRNGEHADELSITVSEFVDNAPAELEIEILAGELGLDTRKLTVPRIQKLGLALAGFAHYVHPGRLQIVGQSEIWFLGQLESEARRDRISHLSLEQIACVLITKGLEPPSELLIAADIAHMPLLRTPIVSSAAITLVTESLQKALAPRTVLHGVLLDLYGLGVLIEGASGIGKSECALDLITRGHRLVSDDVIEVQRISADKLNGSAPELLREHLEIRGLGIINIRDLFGVSSISSAAKLDLSIRLERWEDAGDVDRLGIDSRTIEILGVGVPQVLIPVSPGRNLATLVETAVRVQLLKLRGYDAAQTFVARHTEMIREPE
jgi:HPr kinase/phosphorylase